MTHLSQQNSSIQLQLQRLIFVWAYTATLQSLCT
jgi:hypothetical protein